MTALAHHIDESAQLGLLDWKGTNERSEVSEGAVKCNGCGAEYRTGAILATKSAGLAQEARGLGPRPPEVDEEARGHEAPRLLPEADVAEAQARRGTQGEGARRTEAACRRSARRRRRRKRSARLITLRLRGFFGDDNHGIPGAPNPSPSEASAPAPATYVLPHVTALWWKPCLKRAEDSAREHCWFLAPTTYDSWFCWQCRSELGL